MLLLTLGIDASSQALDWVSTYGDDQAQNAEDIVTDDAGNIYVVGNFLGEVDFDPGPGTSNFDADGKQTGYLAKYLPNGDHDFSLALTTSDEAFVTAVEVDDNGDVFVAGTFLKQLNGPNLTLSANDRAVFVAKYDVDMDQFEWSERYEADGNVTLGDIATDGSNVYMTGGFESAITLSEPFSSTDATDIYFVKLASDGFLLVDAVYGGTDKQVTTGVTVTAGEDYYLTGYFKTVLDFGASPLSSADEDGFVAHFSSSHVLQQNVKIAGTDLQFSRAIALDGNGGVLITGDYKVGADFGDGITVGEINGFDVFFAKYDESLVPQWAKAVGSNIDDLATGLTIDGSDNVYFTGVFGETMDLDPGTGMANFTANDEDVFVTVLDPSGDYLFGYQIGGGGSKTSSGGIALGAMDEVVIHGHFDANVNFDPAGTDNIDTQGDFDLFLQSVDPADIIPPVVTVNPLMTSDDTPDLTGDIDDPTATVSVEVNGQPYPATISGSTWSAAVTNVLPPGTYNVIVTATDPASNVGVDATTNELTINLSQSLETAFSFGDGALQQASDVVTDASDNVFIAGNFWGDVDFDPIGMNVLNGVVGIQSGYFARYDEFGNLGFARALYSGTEVSVEAIELDGNGNLFVAGTFVDDMDADPGLGAATLTSAGTRAVFVAKYDENGNYLWGESFDCTNNVTLGDISSDGSGIFIAGFYAGSITISSTFNSVQFDDIFFAKLDASGTVQIEKSYGGNQDQRAYSVVALGSGESYLVGMYRNSLDLIDLTLGNAGGNDEGFLAKIDASGNTAAAIPIGGNNIQEVLAVTADSQNDVLVTGFLVQEVELDGLTTLDRIGPQADDIFIAKYDDQLQLQWGQVIGSDNNGNSHTPAKIASDQDDRVYVMGQFSGAIGWNPADVGTTQAALGASDLFVTVLDDNGIFSNAFQIGGAGADVNPGGISPISASEMLLHGTFNSGSVDFDPFGDVQNLTYTGGEDVFLLKALLPIPVDMIPPTVDIQNAPATINLTPYTVTIEFSEPVAGFEAAEIVVANAVKSNFAGSGTTYTVDITPTGAGDITIDVAADVAQDAATNGNEAATQVVTTFDGTAPTVDIQNAPATINLSAYTVTIEFSEAVTGFEEAEIVVANAAKSNFAGSGTTYTLDITPTGAGDITIDVAADVAQDAATNGNEAATQVITIVRRHCTHCGYSQCPSHQQHHSFHGDD